MFYKCIIKVFTCYMFDLKFVRIQYLCFFVIVIYNVIEYSYLGTSKFTYTVSSGVVHVSVILCIVLGIVLHVIENKG